MSPMLLAAAKSGEAVKAGPIGLAVILLLCIACYFLFKSMSKHMRNVREGFPAQGMSSATAHAAATPVSLVKRERTGGSVEQQPTDHPRDE